MTLLVGRKRETNGRATGKYMECKERIETHKIGCADVRDPLRHSVNDLSVATSSSDCTDPLSAAGDASDDDDAAAFFALRAFWRFHNQSAARPSTNTATGTAIARANVSFDVLDALEEPWYSDMYTYKTLEVVRFNSGG